MSLSISWLGTPAASIRSWSMATLQCVVCTKGHSCGHTNRIAVDEKGVKDTHPKQSHGLVAVAVLTAPWGAPSGRLGNSMRMIAEASADSYSVLLSNSQFFSDTLLPGATSMMRWPSRSANVQSARVSSDFDMQLPKTRCVNLSFLLQPKR